MKRILSALLMLFLVVGFVHAESVSLLSRYGMSDDEMTTLADYSNADEKGSPASADRVLIEDSADSYVKKWVQVGNISGSTDHGSLTGLGDDDHTQYHNDTRADTWFAGKKLDDLATPDDNTDLNASTSAHGLCPKLSGTSTEFLNGTGAFSTPAGGGTGDVTRQDIAENVSGRGPAYHFNTDDYISIGDEADLEFDTEFSLIVIAKRNSDTISANESLFSKYSTSGDNREWNFGIYSDGKLQITFGDPSDGTYEGKNISDSAVSDLDKEHVYGVTYNAGTVILYVDGEAIASTDTNTPSSLYNGTSSAEIGRIASGAEYFNGDINTVLSFNTVLSADEMKAYANGGLVPFCYQGASQTNLITATNDQDFSSGTIGNWVVYTNGNGTLVYAAGPGSEKCGKITTGATTGTYTYAILTTGYTTNAAAYKVHEYSADVYIPSSNNNFTTIGLYPGAMTDVEILETNSANFALEDQWQRINIVFLVAADGDGTIQMQTRSATAGDYIYFDNVSHRQIGCVADFNPGGATPSYWYSQYDTWSDTTPTGIKGTISGATLVNNFQSIYVEGPVSASAFTDRTKFFEGDALAEIAKIKSVNGMIDHTSLPEFVQKKYIQRDSVVTYSDPVKIAVEDTKIVDGKLLPVDYEIAKDQPILKEVIEVEGELFERDKTITPVETEVIERDIGGSVSMNTVAIQQLWELFKALDAVNDAQDALITAQDARIKALETAKEAVISK